MTVKELRVLASENEIELDSKMTKAEIIEQLSTENEG